MTIMHIRKDDMVEVITGDDKGTRGKVLRVLRDEEQGRGRGRQPRVPAPEAEPPQPAGRPALQGDAGRRLQRDADRPGTASATRVGVRYPPTAARNSTPRRAARGIRLLSQAEPEVRRRSETAFSRKPNSAVPRV